MPVSGRYLFCVHIVTDNHNSKYDYRNYYTLYLQIDDDNYNQYNTAVVSGSNGFDYSTIFEEEVSVISGQKIGWLMSGIAAQSTII